ncbi:MAG TPA: hypothetical protein DEF42_14450 [Desulfosporosinus sp.]|nr:hypothetical protein [Desulfosporosinus sp.]
MERLILLLLGIAVIFAGITYLLGRVLSRVKSIKYSPAVLCLIVGLYYLYLAKIVRSGEGFEDLANVLLSVMSLTGFVSGLITALILDFVLPQFKP